MAFNKVFDHGRHSSFGCLAPMSGGMCRKTKNEQTKNATGITKSCPVPESCSCVMGYNNTSGFYCLEVLHPVFPYFLKYGRGARISKSISRRIQEFGIRNSEFNSGILQ